MRFKLYWAALVSALIGVVYWKNHRMYRDKSRKFKLVKTGIESSILASAAAWLPAFFVVYGTAYTTKPLEKRPYIRMGVAAVVGITLMVSMTYVLELVVLLGVWAIELLSQDFIAFMKERRDARTNKAVA